MVHNTLSAPHSGIEESRLEIDDARASLLVRGTNRVRKGAGLAQSAAKALQLLAASPPAKGKVAHSNRAGITINQCHGEGHSGLDGVSDDARF